MSIGQITIAQAAKGTWRALWKGLMWAVFVMASAYALGVEWNWRVCTLCILSSFFDYMIYQPSRRVGGSRE